MERINVAELLKDCPKGMELDCTIFDDVELMEVDTKSDTIILRVGNKFIRTLNKYGQDDNIDYAKCVIFPKGKTTWEGFVPPLPPRQFKDGDVIVDKSGAVVIYKRVHSSFEEPYVDFHCGITSKNRSFFIKDSDSLQHCGEIDTIRFASEEEKQELFDAIKANGYTWNSKTKTLEKLIELIFKDGDILAFGTENGAQLFIFKEYIRHDYVKCYMMLDCGGEIDFESGDYYVERLATEEEKQKLFQAIKENGYKWNAETKTLEELIESKEDMEDKTVMAGIYFDREYYADEVELHLNNYEIEIRDGKTYAIFKNKETKILKPRFKVGDRIRKIGELSTYTISEIKDSHYFCGNYLICDTCDTDWELVLDKFDINTLKPFESKVLVRNDKDQYWIPAFWGCKCTDGYTTTYGWCKYCIPFDGNEHLLESNKECDKFYRTWEKIGD